MNTTGTMESDAPVKRSGLRNDSSSCNRGRLIRVQGHGLLFLQHPLRKEDFVSRPKAFLRVRFRRPAAQPVSIGRHASSENSCEASVTLPHICPMHPEVRQQGAGFCPKCGMDLEPETITASPTKTEYTCPMHPEIVRDAPGSCPICGMALEPRTISLEEENPELAQMSRRFW